MYVPLPGPPSVTKYGSDALAANAMPSQYRSCTAFQSYVNSLCRSSFSIKIPQPLLSHIVALKSETRSERACQHCSGARVSNWHTEGGWTRVECTHPPVTSPTHSHMVAKGGRFSPTVCITGFGSVGGSKIPARPTVAAAAR